MYFHTFTSPSLLCQTFRMFCRLYCREVFFCVCVCLSEHLNTGWKKDDFPHYYLDLRLCENLGSAVCPLTLITDYLVK